MKRLEAFCEEAASLLLTAYLFIIFCMFPFYLRNGYFEVGKEKYNFYKVITMGGFSLIIPFVLLCTGLHFINRKSDGKAATAEEPEGVGRITVKDETVNGEERGTAERKTVNGNGTAAEDETDDGEEEMQEPAAGWRGRLSGTDWAVLAYGVCVILSYIGSDYKQTALSGENGWYMGTVMQLVFVLSYFLVSRFWEYEEKLLLPVMGAAGAVFLGVLNRFSIYPFLVKGSENTSFLSTMGNINWYSGYWSVLFPVGFILYWKADELWLRMAGLLFTAAGIATGVSQGSNSVFIVFAGLYVFLFCISFQSTKAMKRFFQLAILFCMVCQGLRLWRLRKPAAFNYYRGSVSDWITLSRVTMAGFILLAILYILLCILEKRKHFDVTGMKIVRQIVLLIVVVAVGVYAFLLAVNSNTENGIRILGSLPALTFNEQWGSARGLPGWLAWKFTVIYRGRKLIGVGPDCFANFLYTIPDLAKSVNKQFDGARLTNAHNEWLNTLVNVGILGLISYGSIFISATVRFIYYGERVFKGKGKYLCIFGFSAFAYMIHNVVSFQQILSTPYVFLMLGMGECLLRMEKGS